MNTSISRLILLLAFGNVLLGVASYAAADDLRPAKNLDPAVTVRFADLNPATPEGVQALYGRITTAAQNVCGPSSSTWNAFQRMNAKICYQTTIDHAVKQINLPKLTALHESLTHGPVRQAELPAGNPSRSEVAANK